MDLNDQFDYLKNMNRIRCLEDVIENYNSSYSHKVFGDEAIITGICSVLNPDDNLSIINKFSSYSLLRGINSKAILDETINNQTSVSMHNFLKFEKKVYVGNKVLMSGLVNAVDTAYKTLRNKENRHNVCFFSNNELGDNSFGYPMALADDLNIPIIFCCIDNFNISKNEEGNSRNWFKLYNIEGAEVESYDIFDVVSKIKNAISYITNNKRPFVLDFNFPYSDSGVNLKKCPIDFLSKKLFSEGLLTDQSYQKIKTDSIHEIDEAVSFAKFNNSNSCNLSENLFAF